MQDTSTIDIDLSAIDHNMAVIRRVVGDGCALCPIVKADAYGLGVGNVARRLVAAGAEMLAVYSLRQAIETAAAINGAKPVLVLMPVTRIEREDELVRLMLAGQLHLVVHDEANLEALEAKIRDGNLAPKEVETALKSQRTDFPDGIPECGADALRFGLLAYTVQGACAGARRRPRRWPQARAP